MSFDLVFFGGTGDLTWRKLMPALFQAFRHGKLPEGGRILAVARDDQTDERYREWLKERFREVDGAKRPNDEEFERFAALLHYKRMDLSQPEHYQGPKVTCVFTVVSLMNSSAPIARFDRPRASSSVPSA